MVSVSLNGNRKHRNIMIASMIIVGLVISLIAALIIFYQPSTPKPTPTKLNVNISMNNSNVLQGGNLLGQVYVSVIGNAGNLTLGYDACSSGVGCSFEPAMGTSNFTSTLTMNVPDSTPTGNYTLVVTASGDGAAANASCVISVVGANVLSPNVTVSGTASGSLGQTTLTQIQFVDTQTGATIVDNTPSGTYSATLQNEHIYLVTLKVSGPFGQPHTYDGGNLYVYAPAGNTTMRNDFFVPL
jgi:hypothetical protein